MQEMWEKFVMMGAMAGMNCLLRGTIGEIAATDDGVVKELNVEPSGEYGVSSAETMLQRL
jgi:hypothetical protein